MIEVRRDEDYELRGFVAEAGDRWLAATVFGAELGHRDDYDEAVPQLTQPRWLLLDHGWSDDQYTRWLADLLQHAIFDRDSH